MWKFPKHWKRSSETTNLLEDELNSFYVRFLQYLIELAVSLGKYSVSSLVVPKMEEGISGTGAVKNSK